VRAIPGARRLEHRPGLGGLGSGSCLYFAQHGVPGTRAVLDHAIATAEAAPTRGLVSAVGKGVWMQWLNTVSDAAERRPDIDQATGVPLDDWLKLRPLFTPPGFGGGSPALLYRTPWAPCAFEPKYTIWGSISRPLLSIAWPLLPFCCYSAVSCTGVPMCRSSAGCFQNFYERLFAILPSPQELFDEHLNGNCLTRSMLGERNRRGCIYGAVSNLASTFLAHGPELMHAVAHECSALGNTSSDRFAAGLDSGTRRPPSACL
jgi:hypothetical protein